MAAGHPHMIHRAAAEIRGPGLAEVHRARTQQQQVVKEAPAVGHPVEVHPHPTTAQPQDQL